MQGKERPAHLVFQPRDHFLTELAPQACPKAAISMHWQALSEHAPKWRALEEALPALELDNTPSMSFAYNPLLSAQHGRAEVVHDSQSRMVFRSAPQKSRASHLWPPLYLDVMHKASLRRETKSVPYECLAIIIVRIILQIPKPLLLKRKQFPLCKFGRPKICSTERHRGSPTCHPRFRHITVRYRQYGISQEVARSFTPESLSRNTTMAVADPDTPQAGGWSAC
jgi:hypothetical protein